MLNASSPETSDAYAYGGITLFFAGGVILLALGSQYIGGLVPCPLCLTQRYAYYGSIPVLFIAMALIGEKPGVAAALFFLVSLAFLANAGLGVYHAGAEWKFWPGPDTCGAEQALPTKASDLLGQLETAVVVRCDEAAIRVLGLSMAGWNVIASLIASTTALKAAFLAASSRN